MSRRPPVVEAGVLAGTYSDKYESRNPIARALVRGFDRAVLDLARQSGARELHEVGCGEGHLTVAFARAGFAVRASDLSPVIVDEARAAVARAGLEARFEVASVHDLDPARHAAPLVACCEVLEHLAEPRRALATLAGLACPWLLASVPREPTWRLLNVLRGRYLRDLGNTPGHVQHWSRRGFLALLGERFEVVAVRSPLPWTVALCRVRGAASD